MPITTIPTPSVTATIGTIFPPTVAGTTSVFTPSIKAGVSRTPNTIALTTTSGTFVPATKPSPTVEFLVGNKSMQAFVPTAIVFPPQPTVTIAQAVVPQPSVSVTLATVVVGPIAALTTMPVATKRVNAPVVPAPVAARASPYPDIYHLSNLYAMYDPSDVTTLFTDVARTQNVVTTGDPVRGVTDLSGGGRHLSEPANPPLFETATQNVKSAMKFGVTWLPGGEGTWVYDGTLRKTTSPFGSLPQPFTVLLVAARKTVDTLDTFFSGANTAAKLEGTATQQYALQAGSTLTGGVSDTSFHAFAARFSGSGPASVPSLAAWYDFSDAATLYQDTARTSQVTTDGQQIAGVTDKSGYERHLSQATSTLRPLHKTLIVNGRSVARSDGGDDILQTASAATWLNGGAYTVFAVCRVSNTDAGNDYYCGTNQNSVNQGLHLGYRDAAQVTVAQFSNDANFAFAKEPTFHVHTAAYTDPGSQYWVDGVSKGVGVNPSADLNVTTGVLNVCAGYAGGVQSFGGDIAELVIYNRALTTTERQWVEAYLGTRYGVTVAGGGSSGATVGELFANGGPPKLTGDVGTLALDGFRLGANEASQAESALNGDIAFAAIFSKPLTLSDLDLFGAYSTDKWFKTHPERRWHMSSATPFVRGSLNRTLVTVPATTTMPPVLAGQITIANLSTVVATTTMPAPTISRTANPQVALSTIDARAFIGVPGMYPTVGGTAFIQRTGLVHTFGTRKVDPSLVQRRVGNFQDVWSAAGGPMSASCVVSNDEYQAFSSEYALGKTWKVYDTRSGSYIFAGEIKEPVYAVGVDDITADGWGRRADADTHERLLFTNQNMNMWLAGDQDPLSYYKTDKSWFETEVNGNQMVFTVHRRMVFRKNAAGQPSDGWHNGMFFWTPNVKIKRIAFDIEKSHDDHRYEIQLVAAPLGPDGTLQVIRAWSLAASGPSSVDHLIQGNYELIGLRVRRDPGFPTKKAKFRRFRIKDVRVGSIALVENYTLADGFNELLTRAGATQKSVEGSTVVMTPYDVQNTSYAKTMDDIALLDSWFWRLEPGPTGQKLGVAGRLEGGTLAHTWQVDNVHMPVRPVPMDRYNKVSYEYAYGGGHVAVGVVSSVPNPFPAGYDQTYALKVAQPAIQPLMEKFAQSIANYLAKERFTGNATFSEVSSGQAAAMVKPGDTLILPNNGGVTVVVDEMRHTNDAATAEVDFASGNPLLDRWLAERERLINMGLDPNAATMALLGVQEPKAVPTNSINIEFRHHTTLKGKRDYDAVVSWDAVVEDVEGTGTAIDAYHVKIRPCFKGTQNPVPDSQGGGWRRRVTREPGDDEDPYVDVPLKERFINIPHPTKWRWEARVQAEDALGQLSAWSGSQYSPTPAAFGPDDLTGSPTLDVDMHKVHVYWENVVPTEVDADTGETVMKDSIHHFQVAFGENAPQANGNLPNPTRFDKIHMGTAKTWKISKPVKGRTYYAAVRTVDQHRNFGAWKTTSATMGTPSSPGQPLVMFDARGTRHSRYRALVTPAFVVATDDDIDRYVIQLAHSDQNSGATPPGGTPRDAKRVTGDSTGDDVQAVFRNIPKHHYVWARCRAIDTQNKKSDWGPWRAAGRPRDNPAQGEAPGGVTGLTKNTKVPRRIVWDWNDPNDDITTRWGIVVKRQGVQVEPAPGEPPKTVRQSRYVYRVPEENKGQAHQIEITPMDDIQAVASAATDIGTDTGDIEAEIKPGSIVDLTPFASSIAPVQIVSALPVLPNANYPIGCCVVVTSSGKLYRNFNNTWTAATPTTDLTGQISANQIQANSITSNQIAADSLTSGVIAAGAISTSELAAQAVTVDKLAVNGELIAWTITASLFQTDYGGNRVVINGKNEKDRVAFHAGGSITQLVASGGGLMIGAHTGQQVGFWGNSPGGKPSFTSQLSNTSGTANDGNARDKINEVINKLQNIGLL